MQQSEEKRSRSSQVQVANEHESSSSAEDSDSKAWKERRLESLHADGIEMDNNEIVRLWEERGKVASARGTLFHYHCEAYCNGRMIEAPHSPEFRMFLLLFDSLRRMGLHPFRTEVCVYHVGLCVAGQLDALFQAESGGRFALLN